MCIRDSGADAAEIGHRIPIGRVEGGLQDGCREYDFIVPGVIIGIDGLGSHPPFASVHGIVSGDVYKRQVYPAFYLLFCLRRSCAGRRNLPSLVLSREHL